MYSMPFCSQCGNQVADRDVYCARCGSRQPITAPPPPRPGDPFQGVNSRTASILCYIPAVGWIASVVVLAADKFRNDYVARFHAFQGLYLFVAWLIEDWVLRPAFHGMHFGLDKLVKAVLLGASILMMVKASHNERYSLPIIGELAERSLAEK
jgi:uncharacterized membrane protein